MDLRTFSTVELAQHISDVTHAAAVEPVAITRRGQPQFVLMSVERYQKLTSLSDPRRSHAVEHMPDEHIALLESALRDQTGEPPHD